MSNQFGETEVEVETERQELFPVVIGCIIGYVFVMLIGILIGISMFV